MSIHIYDHVWQESRHGGGDLLLLLALADYAGDHGIAWPAVGTLARKIRQTDRHVPRLLKRLSGGHKPELEIMRGAGPCGAHLYRITLPSMKHCPTCQQARAEGPAFRQGGGDILSPPCPSVHLTSAAETPDKMSGDPSRRDPSKETNTTRAREDEPLPSQIPVKEPSNKPEAETPCVCEDERMADEPEAQPEPEPMPQPEPQAALLTPCPYDPAFPCEHQQDIAEAIAPMVGNYVRVKAGDVPAEVAHAWTVPEVTLLYDWLTQVKAPDDPAWWRLRNAFSPTHRDDNLCMARQWAAKRDAKRSAAVCPHPPNRIGYNPMLAQYHCFGCFHDVPVEVASALGCDEHLDIAP